MLREQIKRGIEIRLFADPGFASRPFLEALDLLGVTLPDHTCKVEAGNQTLNQALQGIGTPRLTRGDKLHHKFAVIDNRKVIAGSFNWSPSAAHTNDKTLLVIHTHRNSPNISSEKWNASGTPLSWGSLRTSNANSTANGSAAGMGRREAERAESFPRNDMG